MRNIHLLFLCVLFFCGSCSDEDRNPISNEDIYLNLYYSHNGESQQILQGDTIKHQDGDLTFLYYYYYLPTINVQMYISKDRIIKHEDTFYYRIIFDGQTQLAL